jgi:ribonuclease M5
LIKVKEAVIVEGKYDKIKLSSIIDGLIIETRGFQIFSDKKQMDLIRRLADTRGILVLTDSDGAGFVIRNYLTGAIAPDKIKHAYIPDILGKEKRKEKASKEGKLGVEGVSVKIILDALNRAGVVCGSDEMPAGRKITKTDLYLAGLSGGENSAQKRQELLTELSLPAHLAPNSLIGVLNSIMSYDEFYKLLDKLFKNI